MISLQIQELEASLEEACHQAHAAEQDSIETAAVLKEGLKKGNTAFDLFTESSQVGQSQHHHIKALTKHK